MPNSFINPRKPRQDNRFNTEEHDLNYGKKSPMHVNHCSGRGGNP